MFDRTDRETRLILFVLLLLLALCALAVSRADAQQIDWNTQIKNKPAQLGFPPTSDCIQYVSSAGSDLNDGLSWSTGKATCAAARAALAGCSTAIIYEAPALPGSDCIAATGNSTGLNGWIWAPARFYIGPSAQATALQNQNSLELRIAGSLWNGVPADDFYTFKVFENSTALSTGSDFELNHSSISGGAGRFSIFTDTVVQAPRSATTLLNSNSFAFDIQGNYFDSGNQGMLWEMGNTVSCDGCALASTIFRQNFVPIFTSTCTGCQAEYALGGSGTLSVSGNYAGAPKWLFTNLRGSSFNTMTFEHAATSPRTKTFADATGIVPDLAGSVGQIQFNNTSDLGADANLFWDNANKRLGIGQSTPLAPFHVKTSTAGGWPQFEIENTATGGQNWWFGGTDTGNGAGGGKFVIHHTNSSSGGELTIDSSTGNVGIGVTAPGFGLDVNGRINASNAFLRNGAVAIAGKYLKSDGTNGYQDSSGSASGVGACAAHNWASTLNSDASPTCTQPSLSDLTSSGQHALLSSTHNDTIAHTVARGDIIAGIGASPTWTAVAKGSTNSYPKWNSSGDVVSSTNPASGTGSCATHQFETASNADAAPTCAQPAASDLSNGTTGSGSVVLATSPSLTTPNIGTATATSVLGIGFQQQIFTATGSSTFTVPTGITQIKVTIVGAGGAGGGGSTAASNSGGSGGGAGGVAIKWLTGLTPGNTISVTVGTGGTGVAGGTGNSGGNSSIASGTQTITTVTANGGGGGAVNAFGGTGGSTTNGDLNFMGAVGLQTFTNNSGNNGSAGASSMFGAGGNGVSGGTNGNNGGTVGSGGGGAGGAAASTKTGGNGANGIVIFEWVA